jgi:hypothetical protein
VALRNGARMDQVLKSGEGGKSSLVQVGEFSNKDDNRSTVVFVTSALCLKESRIFRSALVQRV